ncbi:kelch domain-containing protein 8B isoform X4 [Parus major]|uniref:kelch domain-containing protein 8B isoform X4 n=1 Tax=Parus major TaxID=9157 RepID=UPI00077108FF|nr:kelch domain-containing protein 8B isoform X4 [Parus major]
MVPSRPGGRGPDQWPAGPDGRHGRARARRPPGRLSWPMAAGAGAFAWATFPAMPTRRVYCSAAHRDGQLFVLGGCGGGGRALGTAEVLDVPSQRWTTLPPLPTPRAGAAALALGKQILVVGGVDAAQSPLASVEVYHVDEGKWEKKAALAQPSMGISAVQRDGAVYALGGMGADTSPQALVRVYEPAKDHWQPLPSMPTPCYGASAFLQGNKIFVLGVWRKPSRTIRMKEKRADFVAGCLGGRVVAVGGLGNAGGNQSCPLDSVEGFSLSQKKWEPLPPMPTGRCSCSSCPAPSLLFIIGGVAQGPSGAVEALCLRDVP